MQNDIVRQPPKPKEEPPAAPVAVAETQSAPSPEPTPEKTVPATNKSTIPVGVISVAVLLCLLLVGAAVFAGLRPDAG